MEDSRVVPLISSDSNKSKRRSIFLVKFTDACRTNLDHILKTVSAKSAFIEVGSVEIAGNEGTFCLGLASNGGGPTPVEYKFSISDMHSELAKGQLQAVRQRGDHSAIEEIGQITQRLKINANDKETFELTKQKALQEMVEAKKQSEKISSIKQPKTASGASTSKSALQKWQRVTKDASHVQRPLTPVGHSKQQMGGKIVTPPNSTSSSLAASTSKFGDVSKKSLRQRIIQHLALRCVKTADLLQRLNAEGLHDEDRNMFDNLLNDVAQMKSNGDMELRSSAWLDVRTDWPHYAKYDAEVVKKNVAAKKLTQNNGTIGGKTSSAAAEINMYKKDDSGKSRVVPPPPITLSSLGTVNASQSPPTATAAAASAYSSPLDLLIPEEAASTDGRRRTGKRRNADSLSSNVALTKNGDVHPPPAKESAVEGFKTVNNTSSSDIKSSKQSKSSKSTKGLSNGRSSNGIALPPSSKKADEKVKEAKLGERAAAVGDMRQSRTNVGVNDETLSACDNNNETRIVNGGRGGSSPDFKQHQTTGGDEMDYLEEFPPIRNGDERRRYKELFDKDYNRYMAAYNKLREVAMEFEKLGERLDKLSDKHSSEYKSVETEIYNKYRNFEQDPAIAKYKNDHERLRSKLSVLKERVKEFDESISSAF